MHVSPREAESSKQLTHTDLGSCATLTHTSHSNLDNPDATLPPKKRCLRNFPLKWGYTTGV